MKSALAALAVTITTTAAQPVNTELVVNGDAETGDTSGWVNDGIDAIPALGGAGGFGAWTFTAGEGPELDQRLTQDIAITTLAPAIDAGNARASFSLYIQSRSDGGTTDTGSALLTFLDANGATIDQDVLVDPPTPSGTWDLYTIDRGAPAQTRTIRVVLDADRNGGFSTDCFFDEVSLRLLGCNPADLAEPLGVLDLSDINAFVAGFSAQDPAADLTGDGIFDLADVSAFVAAFLAGCP